MTTCFLAPDPIQSTQFIPGGAVPASGGQLFFYTAGSSTKTTVYKDNAAAVAWSNPIVLDSGGNLPLGGVVWIPTGVTIKVVFAPSNDTDPPASPYWSKDNLAGVNDITSGSPSEWISGPVPTFIGTTSFSVVGDQTTTFHVGRRIKTTNTGGTVYSYISKSVFAIGITTITVVNDSLTLDSGLSAVFYGLLDSTNQSIPQVRSNTFAIADATDPTKTVSFIVSSVATSTQAQLSIPNYTSPIIVGLPPGIIMDYANTTAPAGWLECDGSAYSRTGTTAGLFSAIGTTWGQGNSTTTFNVPDFRGKFRMGQGTGNFVEFQANVSATANAVPVASNIDKWITGMSATLSAVSGFTGTISSAGAVFVVRNNATSVKFASSLANAQNLTADITATSTGTFTITRSLSARTLGSGGGEEAHAMSVTELIAHTHTGGLSGAGVNVSGSGTAFAATGSTGGNAAANVTIPYYTVMTIIKT